MFYFDESGFSLVPQVPYAWQHKDLPILLSSSRSKQLNVLGFIKKNNKFSPYVFEGSITSEVVTACFDDFCKSLQRRTIVVLDNASIHSSQIFEDKILDWEEKGLFLYKIPIYSPELNKIEILWKHIKYYWLPFEAYKSFSALKENLDYVLTQIGKKHVINFV